MARVASDWLSNRFTIRFCLVAGVLICLLAAPVQEWPDASVVRSDRGPLAHVGRRMRASHPACFDYRQNNAGEDALIAGRLQPAVDGITRYALLRHTGIAIDKLNYLGMLRASRIRSAAPKVIGLPG